MAKRKRKPGGSSGKPVLKPIKDYRDDPYVPYIFRAERGIVSVWDAVPDIRDGDVRQALRRLIKIAQGLDSAEDEPPNLQDSSFEFGFDDRHDVLCTAIMAGLQDAFEEYGPLILEDMIGVLKQINYSVGNLNTGMHQQGYLRFVSGFLDEAEGKTSGFLRMVIERLAKIKPGEL
jgi:hypothetical protein